MEEMRNCYDSLLSAAAATMNSVYGRLWSFHMWSYISNKQHCLHWYNGIAYSCNSFIISCNQTHAEFAEAMEEMGTCLLEKTALNYDDDDSGELSGSIRYKMWKLVREQLLLAVFVGQYISRHRVGLACFHTSVFPSKLPGCSLRSSNEEFLCYFFLSYRSIWSSLLYLFCFALLPAGRVLMMLGKAQFELQKFVDNYVNFFATLVKLHWNLVSHLFKRITIFSKLC